MKFLLAIGLLATVVVAKYDSDWLMWKREHGKEYSDQDTEEQRHAIWLGNKKMIEEHNAMADQYGYILGMNHFGDMTPEEVKIMMNGYTMRPVETNLTKVFTASPDFKPDANVDWRIGGYVTAVKNQGQCGSCWAFSTTGSLEGQHFKSTGHVGDIVSLSEQNLMDCSTREGNKGCKGGLMDNAFRYIIQNGGIDTEESYPYQAHDETCRFKKADVGATMTSFKDVEHDSTSALMQACGDIGPISVAMDASRQTFHFYKQGVYKDSKCSSTKLDHGVLLVGYGTTDEGEDYFLVKNSWGTVWGMEGYFMISRENNLCGLATQASYPIV